MSVIAFDGSNGEFLILGSLKQCIDKIPVGPNRAVWTDNGRIFAKYTKDSNQSHSLQIKTASDIDRFIREINHLLPAPPTVAGT